MTMPTDNRPAVVLGGDQTFLHNLFLAIAGTVVLAISARVQVPSWPVPMTMQTAAVMAVGLAYGLRLGTATLLLYLAEGAIGLPVFASGAGLAYLAGPTAGYLAGFVVAASLLGWMADRSITRDWRLLVGGLVAATGVIFIPGAIWLAVFTGSAAALVSGVVPFLPGAVLKAALVALIYRKALSLR